VVVVGSAAGQQSDVDVDELINAMTLDEKLTLLHGVGFFGTPARCLGSAGYVAGIERLSIPGMCLSDGPAGVRVSESATAMSAPVSLAATFDPDRAYAYGTVIGLTLGPMSGWSPAAAARSSSALPRATFAFREPS